MRASRVLQRLERWDAIRFDGELPPQEGMERGTRCFKLGRGFVGSEPRVDRSRFSGDATGSTFQPPADESVEADPGYESIRDESGDIVRDEWGDPIREEPSDSSCEVP
jgi:hypothetical protein